MSHDGKKPCGTVNPDFESVPDVRSHKASGGQGSHRVPSGEWLTTNEAAEYLKVKSRTLLLWARQGKLKGYILSGVKRHVWRFRKIDLDATLELPSVRSAERMVQ
jgi:excisionase family DNA binding protein